jgi:hypothetical protein
MVRFAPKFCTKEPNRFKFWCIFLEFCFKVASSICPRHRLWGALERQLFFVALASDDALSHGRRVR